jgi:Flp pilus assembly pilin Flp
VKSLWKDEAGAVLSAELMLLMTIVVIGVVVGLKAVQQAVDNELFDVAAAIGAVDQSYSYAGVTGCCAVVEGSQFIDAADQCDGPNVQTAGTVGTIDVCLPPAGGEGPGV